MSSRANRRTALPDPTIGSEHLSQAERHLTEGEERITRQMLLIDRMRRDGHDVREAERLLPTLRETLVALQVHRDEILRKLERNNELRSRYAACATVKAQRMRLMGRHGLTRG